MAHIHTEPGQHDHTASAFIVRLDKDEPKILLHVHKLLKKYLQFGGHIELNEDPWQAIVHETKEESGYDISQLKILQPKLRVKHVSGVKLHPYPVYHKTHKFDDNHNHTDIAYVFITKEKPKHAISDGESQSIRELTKQEILNLPSEKIFKNTQEVCEFIFDKILDNWEEVNPSEFD